MKKILLILLVLSVSVLSAQEYNRPKDGVYETTGDWTLGGELYSNVSLSRIGVSIYRGRIYYLYDSDDDGLLDDEEMMTYKANLLTDGIIFDTGEPGFGETLFTYVLADSIWRTYVWDDEGTKITIDFYYIGGMK